MIGWNGLRYITPREASRKFALALPTIYRWCREGKVELLNPTEREERELSGKYWILESSLRELQMGVFFT